MVLFAKFAFCYGFKNKLKSINLFSFPVNASFKKFF